MCGLALRWLIALQGTLSEASLKWRSQLRRPPSSSSPPPPKPSRQMPLKWLQILLQLVADVRHTCVCMPPHAITNTHAHTYIYIRRYMLMSHMAVAQIQYYVNIYAIRRTYILACCCAHFYVVIESYSCSYSKSRKIKYSTYLCQVNSFHVQGDRNQHK